MKRAALPQVLVLTALAALAAGCGEASVAPRADDADDADAGTPGTLSTPTDPPADGEWLVGTGMVLDDGDGPEVCLGGVATSLPPQCGGPKVVGWEWSEIRDMQSTSGTTWTGDYVLTGTYAQNTFTLTKPPVSADEYDGPRPTPPDDSERFLTPCPEPAGGWLPVDPAKATERSLDRVAREAQRLDGFADLWWDQSINESDDEMAMNDPTKLIVNVRVVGDTDVAERALREVWGGALCVTEARRTESELRRIQTELTEIPGILSSDAGRDVVNVQVVHDDGSIQRRMDEEYGAGVVRVDSALTSLRGLSD